MAKPDDTRCQAATGKGRCKNEITFDTAGDFWSRWCEKHNAQENAARVEGGERVRKFVENEAE